MSLEINPFIAKNGKNQEWLLKSSFFINNSTSNSFQFTFLAFIHNDFKSDIPAYIRSVVTCESLFRRSYLLLSKVNPLKMDFYV